MCSSDLHKIVEIDISLYNKSVVLDNSVIVDVGVVFAICNHSIAFGSHENGWWSGALLAKSLEFGLNQTSIQTIREGDFLGGPVARTLHSQWRGLGLIPGQGTRSPMLQLRHRQGKKGNVCSNRKK